MLGGGKKLSSSLEDRDWKKGYLDYRETISGSWSEHRQVEKRVIPYGGPLSKRALGEARTVEGGVLLFEECCF